MSDIAIVEMKIMKYLLALNVCLNFMSFCYMMPIVPETDRIVQRAVTDVSQGLTSFHSPQELFSQDYSFLYAHFYKTDYFFYEKNLENPLNLSTDFMVQCLSELYALRTDIICEPTNKAVDALIIAGFSEGSISERFLALKKSMEKHAWRFNKIHVFVSDMQHAEHCKKILVKLFPGNHQLLPINWVFTHCQTGVFARGLKVLKLSDQLAPYYLIIEKSIQFSEKHVLESRRILYDKSICLGANVFQSDNWLESAKMHNYHMLYPHYNDMVCAWFHAEMNFYVRRLHYYFIYHEDLKYKENYLSTHIKQKNMHHDLEESYYFKKFSAIFLNKSLVEQDKTRCFFELLRSLGLLVYAQQNCASLHYDIAKQLDIIKEALVCDLNKKLLNRLVQQSHLRSTYKSYLNFICRNSSDKYATISWDDIHLLYKEISHFREVLLKKIIVDSIDLVGAPPCRFAFIIAGSTARKEATPWSDVEFGLLVENRNEDIDDYFLKLNATIFYKIIDLGKMPIYSFGILSLNRYALSGEDLPFIDHVIPAGFALDRLSGGFLPLSEKKDDSYYGTPKQLSLIIDPVSRPKKFNFMITEAFLYGDEALFYSYKTEKRKQNAYIKKQSCDLLKTEIPLFSKIMREPTGQIDIKNTFYRPFTCILESLGAWFEFDAPNSCERIEALHMSGHISMDEAKTLQEFLKKVLALRFALNAKNKQRYYCYCDSALKMEADCLLASKEAVAIIFKNILKEIISVV